MLLSNKSSERHLLSLHQRLANIFWKRSNSKEFLLCGPHSLVATVQLCCGCVKARGSQTTRTGVVVTVNLYLHRQGVGQIWSAGYRYQWLPWFQRTVSSRSSSHTPACLLSPFIRPSIQIFLVTWLPYDLPTISSLGQD